MKRGPKPATAGQKLLTGTFRPDRDSQRYEVIVPDTLPTPPPFLTEGGYRVWSENLGRAAQVGAISELDSEVFANWCCLQATIREAFAAGRTPPAAYLSESRKLAEVFGLLGPRSRVGEDPNAGPNPFNDM